MNRMHRPSHRAARGYLLALAAAIALAACSTSAAEVSEDVPLLIAPPSTTAAPATTTTAPKTTSTEAPTTTALPTTTTIALPVPLPVPEAGTVEPVVELATFELPAIGVVERMYEGVTLGTLDHGPGHWPGSAMPGQIGNMVVGGHRMSHGHPFRDLDLLVPGDELVVTDATGRHVYRVVSTEVVAPDAMWILDQTPASTATLFACHPKGSTKERIVVHLELDRPA